MALKFEIIGNNLVVTDTVDNSVKLERPVGDIFGICDADKFKVVTRNQRNDVLLSKDYTNLVNSVGVALDKNSLTAFFRSKLGFNKAGSAASTTSRRSRQCTVMPYLPRNYDNTPATLTHHDLITLPCHFDAFQLFEFNPGGADVIVDKYAFAVTERIDNITVPVIDGVAYNNIAAAGTQNGWVIPANYPTPAATIPAGSYADQGFLLLPKVNMYSIDRKDNIPGDNFPAFMRRKYINSRTQANTLFTNAAEREAGMAALAPYTYISRAQLGVDGCTDPAAFNNPVNTATTRFSGILLYSRGYVHTIAFWGDSIPAGLGAGGEPVANPRTGLQVTGGWSTQSAVALADLNNPVGFMNLCQPGIGSAAFTAFMKKLVPILKPTINVISTYTPNDTPTNAGVIADERSRALEALQISVDNGAQHVFYAATPYGSASNTLRMNYVNQILNIPDVPVINPNIPGVYNESLPNYFETGANVDAAHLSKLGHDIIKTNQALPTLRLLTYF
jgi:hypothetical protein